MTALSNVTATETAIKLVILDAIEKGHITANEICAYMKSDVFQKAVISYKSIIQNNF